MTTTVLGSYCCQARVRAALPPAQWREQGDSGVGLPLLGSPLGCAQAGGQVQKAPASPAHPPGPQACPFGATCPAGLDSGPGAR